MPEGLATVAEFVVLYCVKVTPASPLMVMCERPLTRLAVSTCILFCSFSKSRIHALGDAFAPIWNADMLASAGSVGGKTSKVKRVSGPDRVKIHDLAMEGIDAVLRKRGYPSAERLKAGKKP
jgi:hypothetical protein